MKNKKKILCLLLAVVLGEISSWSLGYKISDMTKLVRLFPNSRRGSCRNCDLTNIDTPHIPGVGFFVPYASNADLTGSNLSGSNFMGFSLNNTDLTNTNLTGADFTNVKIKSVTLRGALFDANPKISGTLYWNGTAYVPVTIEWLTSQGARFQ